MKLLWLAISLMLCAAQVQAECQVLQNQQNFSYGRICAAERQSQVDEITLREKVVVLNITCDDAQQIRLFTGTALPKDGQFGFGDRGVMSVTASQAVVDDNPVHLAVVHAGDGVQKTNGSEKVSIQLNQGIAFVNGQELRGKTASVTLTFKPKFNSGSITDRTTWRGNLRVRMVTQ